MTLIKLTEIQLQAVRRHLASFGMEDYIDNVVAIIEGRSNSDCLLRLLHTSYQEGMAEGGRQASEAWNNVLEKRRVVANDNKR